MRSDPRIPTPYDGCYFNDSPCRSVLRNLLVGIVLCVIGFIALDESALAQWAHKEGDPLPNTPGRLVQPFTKTQWESSNFASDEDLQWFRDAKYGMFIHFGLSAHNHAEISWAICQTRKVPDVGKGPIPDAVWKQWPKEFKIEKFNARDMVEIAKQGGFRYLVVVAKHHDGFHLWDTAFSEFRVTNTPFKRDYLKEIADACHAADMPFGIYYSQRDWHHADYMPVDPGKVNLKGTRWTLRPGETSPMGERHKKYVEYQFNACKELCTKYGKVDIFWWDAVAWGGMFTAEMWDAERLTRSIRTLQPHIVMNNRCSLPGDFDTPEQRLGRFQDWRPWESAMCLEKAWCYSGNPPKPREEIIQMIVNNACCDGNILLSWGMKWDGSFDDAQKARILEVGKWLKENGRAIYGTRGGPWKYSTWGGSTHRERTIWLHIVKASGPTLTLPVIPERRVVSARLLDGEPVSFQQTSDALEITIPEASQSPIDTVVELLMDRSVDGRKAVE